MLIASGERKMAGYNLSPCKSADLFMASFTLKGFLLIYTRWRSKAGASLRVVRVQDQLLARCLPVLWGDTCVYDMGSVPDGANTDVFLGAMRLGWWLGSHPIACAAGREEEEQLCFSIPG